jgi:transcriptional regulator with XRE-family HTH domain
MNQSHIKMDKITLQLAERLRRERESRGWTIATLARLSGVSRGMISKIERAEASPTAALLGRLSGAFQVPLSDLFEPDPSTAAGRVVRANDQPRWKDPGSGYVRRVVSPRAGRPLELIEVELPRGANVSFPAAAYRRLHQQVWVLEGKLTLREGIQVHELEAGDCIQFGPPADCTFRNEGPRKCTYVVAILHLADGARGGV